MERLLKIVEGPMRGAEIALVAGTRIKVGRGDDCDIVVADASLPETAFELDVADAAVTLILPDGTAREMRPFEIHAFGTTAVALGPAEGVWEELRPLEREAPEETPAETPVEPEPPPAEPAPAEGEEKKKSGFGCAIVCLGVILLILIVLALAWIFRCPLVERVPQLKSVVERIESFVYERASDGKAPQPKRTPTMSLRELAAQHGISYAEKEGRPVLSGNLAHRAERLAIRALALATDRHCELELSDDETLVGSADALLFTVTEGALKVFGVSNRVVTITGYAPSAAALGAALKALRADVPWTGDVDIASVRVGGPVPVEHKSSTFAVSGTLSGARPATAVDVKTVAAAGASTAAAGADVADIKISDVNGRSLPRNMFPVAGVLTRPYPCVVLRDGHRIVEGGQLGTYTVVRIAADALELKQGGGKANWRP